jgi:hypothetical protein
MNNEKYAVGQEVEVTLKGKVMHRGNIVDFIEIDNGTGSRHSIMLYNDTVTIRVIHPIVEIGSTFDTGTDIWVAICCRNKEGNIMLMNTSYPNRIWFWPQEFFTHFPSAVKI